MSSSQEQAAGQVTSPTPKSGWWQEPAYMAAMGMMVAGYYSVEYITNNMIPITARHFTDNAILIAGIIALNRMFGFIVQPYVSWKSDHISTRFGRRRPFLMIGIPSTIINILLVGALPFIFKGEIRHTIPVLATLVLLNVSLQAFVDMNWGSHEPLYADTFKQKMLGRAVAIRAWCINIVSLFMSGYAMKLADTNEFLPYLCSAGLLSISALIVFTIIRERPTPPTDPHARYKPLEHIGLLFKNRDYLKLAVIGGFGIMENAAYMLFLSLLATRSLGLSKAEFGQALFPGPIIAFIISLPAGYFVDRLGPKFVMSGGFLIFGINSALMAFWVHDYGSFLTLQCVYAAAVALVSLPLTSMIFQYASSRERGKVYGLFQFTRAFCAFVFTWILGFAVQFSTADQPIPLYADDIKKAESFIAQIQNQETPLAALIYENLSPGTRELLAQPYVDASDTAKGQREALAADLNAMLRQPDLRHHPAFESIQASGYVRSHFGRTDLTEDQRFILHRVMLHDALPEVISKNVDYRVGYKMDIVLAFLGFLVVLSTRRGRYAQTIRDADVVPEE